MPRIKQITAVGSKKPDQTTRPASRCRSLLEPLVVTVAVLGVLTCLYDIGRRSKPPTGSDITLTQAMLDQWYPYPEKENAADVYARAFSSQHKHNQHYNPEVMSFYAMACADEPFTQEALDQIHAYVQDQTEALALYDRAATIDACRFETYTTEAQDFILTSHHDEMYRGAELLYLAGITECRQGETEKAIQRVRQIMHIAGALHREPTVISAYVSVRIRLNACSLAERLLLSNRLTDQDLLQLEETMVSGRASIPDWYTAMNIQSNNTPVLHRMTNKCRDRNIAVQKHVLAMQQQLNTPLNQKAEVTLARK